MYQLVLTLLVCWLALPVLAQQQLAKARQSSYLTKVFRLTAAQARCLYEEGLGAARPAFFTVPVDSFPTDRPVRRALPHGYYLVAHTEGPQLVYWLRAEVGRTVEVIDNQTDLSLAVRDSLGQLLPGAQVTVAGRPLPYDAATHTYRRTRTDGAGLVAVAAGGRTTYHPLEQSERYPRASAGWWLRAGRRVLYGRPLGYLTVPIWHTVRGLKHPATTITGVVGLLRSPFSESVRNYRQSYREQRHNNRQNARNEQWVSYLALSQPRYRPTGDTLRLKARVLRRDTGRPCTRPLTLQLRTAPGRDKRLATLRPVRPGSYEYTLPLADTLGLRVGTRPSLRLEDAHANTLAEGDFQLEDYELKNSHYTLRMLEKEPRRGQPQAVFLHGTDANELNLLDARVRLVVRPAAEPGRLAGRRLFVADTLWSHTQPLDPLGETRVDLPARIFPNTDFGYVVQATFLTADNERHDEALTLYYRRDPGELHLALSRDSVRLSYDSLGLGRAHRATLTILGEAAADSGRLFRGPVRLPLALPLRPLATAYELCDPAGHTTRLALTSDNAGLTLGSERSADSVQLAVNNPRRLPFWYYVYRGSELRDRGYATAYQLAVREPSAVAWHISLHYPWGGQLHTAEYSVGPPQRQLTVATSQPAVAYPGQRLHLAFRVTDEGGRPVPGADLTAYAYTSKFGQPALPELPSYRRPVPARLSQRRFRLAAGFQEYETTRQLLAWRQWRPQLGLDSLQFYRFLYPESGAFYDYRPAPGGLTQVAVFVVDSGRVQAPIAVYVDEQPAYIHDINQGQPYVALADSGVHTLSVRTANRLVRLAGVYLRPRHKLTLSIDANHPCAELTVAARPPGLDPSELLALRRTLVLVAGQGAATLRQGQVLRPLAERYAVAGPFRPDSVLLRPLGGGRRKFLFEPLYEYRLSPGLLKLTCLDPERLGTLNGYGLPAALPLGDFAYTEADLRPRRPARVVRAERGRYRYAPSPQYQVPSATPVGQGRLALRLPPGQSALATAAAPYPPYPVCTLLTRPGQPKFARLSPGLAVLHALAPGHYRVAVLLSDSSCLAPTEAILVEANGQTYYQLRAADRRAAGALSHQLNQRLYRATPLLLSREQPARREIHVVQPAQPHPNWRLLRGRVIDYTSEEGLPGVTVLVKGTTLGVATAADGSFTLRVPWGSQALLFSSVGYLSQEQSTANQDVFAISLRADYQQLSEVVVTGYSAPERRSISGSVASVQEYSLSGRVAGVQVTGPTGGIRIRGAAVGATDQPPLYIVNGLPFADNVADINPADVLEMKVLKGPAAMALYGARGGNGVILLTTKAGAGRASADHPPGRDPRLALRHHFADYAWWRPTLVTDAQGRAHTDVVLPDDVTSWDTFVIGSDAHGRLGSSTGRLRSFKTLLAELAVPRFLVAGDRAQVLGKALNYLPDTAQVTTTFRVGERVARRQARRVGAAFVDTLSVTAPAAADSLQLTFGLEQASGYADGERRSIPVVAAGTREQVGTYAVLTAADTTVQLALDPRLGEVQVRVERDALPALLSEIEHLQHYAYLCNEQAASRLLGLLLEQRIRTQQGVEFKGQKVVQFLLDKLQKGRHQPEGIWGTWPTSPVSPWATVHVVEALLAAEKAGYPTALDRSQLAAYLLHELDESLSLSDSTAAEPTDYRGHFGAADDQIRLLKLLHDLGAPADYGTYLRRVEGTPRHRRPLDRYLALTELRQQLGLSIQLDTLRLYRQRTELGGAYYADTLRADSYYRYLLPGRVGTTLLAYRILRAQGGHAAELVRMRTFLLGLRGEGYWQSTYETAQILATIGPDLLVPGTGAPAQVRLSGRPGLPAGPVTQFPLALTLPAGPGALLLHKQGGLPVYATAYQTRWNPAPEAVVAPFSVATTLAGQASRHVRLAAGHPTELVVTVEVKAEARYALLEVPIPAGCSYGDPAPTNPLEVHREYLRHQVGIFLDRLPVGRHTFRVALQPRYHGSYTLNPARAELVYFPTRFGRTASKHVSIH